MGGRTHRGFTLVESVVLIIVIALAVPGMMMAVREQDVDAIDQLRRTDATWLASSVLESIMADAASDDPARGFESLNNGAYLSDPTSGLYARLAGAMGVYAGAGLSYSVTIGSAIDLSGAPASDTDPFAVREVSVAVSFTDRSGRLRTATFRTIVANI